MKKFSLQMRLTCLSALLITVICVVMYVLISNSALMKMDSVESNIMRITLFENELENDEGVSVDLVTLIPEIQDSLAETKEAFRTQCLFITIAVIIIGTSLTWVISGIILKPLKKLNRQIEQITANNLSAELPVSNTKDEISALTTSFNLMLKRLDDAFLSQRQFSANAAHELRTPLAVMQTNLEVYKKKKEHDIEECEEVLNTTLRQTEQLGNLTNSLLELMTLHTATMTDQIELSGLTAEIFCDIAPIAEAKNVELTQSGPEVTILGNEILIYRTLYNLIENAIKYNKENGGVAVDLAAQDNLVSIQIKDTGSGIPEEAWDQIFEPFYRVDKARSRSMGGAGIGLALVCDITALHSGKVYVKDSSAEGTTICLEFPVI